MRIVILGAGELGCTIAEILSNEKNDVVVVDSDEAKLEKISRSLDVLTINADGTDPSFTKDPDIKKRPFWSPSPKSTKRIFWLA